ncbi:MAG: anhydro-N-acetylmuramic acid kinase [Alphaproteobacteria bacterium]
MSHTLTALGLMSGTSLDGIDAGLLETDGRAVVRAGPAVTLPYRSELRERLRAILGGGGPAGEVARDLTLAHAEAIDDLLKSAGVEPGTIDLIGFHGHTILHRPQEGRTVQIGDPELLAERTGIAVVSDFRSRDVAEGGQGAPLVPLFHAAITAALRQTQPSIAVLNVGGVANLTWIGGGFDIEASSPDSSQILAFDTGPGNALLDDWARRHTGQLHDAGGRLAAAGTLDRPALAALLEQKFFDLPPPKSLDRNDFDLGPVLLLSPEDGAATLTAFTAGAVARAREHFPKGLRRPGQTKWLVTGGGRHNPSLMKALRQALDEPGLAPIEEIGWDGDALEAHAFAYLAVRSRAGLPLTLPSTTGVRRPTSGGLFTAAA